MKVKQDFFEEVLAQAIRCSGSAVSAATNPIDLKAAHMDVDTIRKFIADIKPIARTPEFRAFLELIILQAYIGLFVSIDGLTATFFKNVMLTDLQGQELGEDLHMDFTGFLLANGYWKHD